jgi:hypothetical protein
LSRSIAVLGVLALAVLALGGCPPAGSGSSGSRQSPVAACVKAGDSCEVSPGKLGLCTQKSDSCQGGAACLSCMSLH